MKRNLTQWVLVLMMLLVSSSMALAQFTASGTVNDPNGDPLVGATVQLRGTALGVFTDSKGGFSLQVPGSTGILLVSYIGYATVEQSVDADDGSLIISMETSSTTLDEVVVTGLATTVKRSNLANSVARVNADELTGVAAQTTVDAALYGKFKGVEIKANSGAPGGGLSFNLRGTTSISGSSQPLIVLDGVYIDNSSIPAGLNIVSAAASGGSTSNQDNPSNRLADIDPNDIESIEVLKGASAAAIYGSRASGGVVIITTKRGTAGKTAVSLSQSLGQSSMLNPLGIRDWTEERVLNSSFAGDIDLFRAAQSSGNLQNYEDLLYGNKGLLSNTRLSISGGDEKTTFYFGSTYKNEEGIVNNTGYEKISTRLNIDHKVSKLVEVSLSSNYVWSSADRGFFNNDNSGTTMGVSFTSTPAWAQLLPNEAGIYPSNPYAPSNFLETAALVTNNERVNRFIGGGTVKLNLITNTNNSLKAIFNGGADFYNLNTTAIFPNTVQFQRDGAGLNGVSAQGFTKSLNTNLAAFLVHTYVLDNGLSLRTSAGVTQFDINQNTILGSANSLIGVQTNLDQAGSRNVIQNRLIQQDKGFFVQEEINWDDKVLVTLGLRGDKSSNNGDVNKLYYYPKANLALNIHKLTDMGTALSQLKVRAAYGESGNFATFGAKSTILNSVIVNGVAGVTVPGLRGNPAVGPERQTELEFGVDIGFFNRFSLDATYYIKSVDDLLLNANVPTSSGFTSQVTNAAALRNTGVEMGLNLEVIDTRDFDWLARFSFWKNTAEVTRLDVPSFTTGGFADFLGNFRVKEGRSPTEIIGVGENPDEDGLVVFGDAAPDFQLSWRNQLRYKNFDFTMLWHWKKGGENINLSTLLFDLNETTHDFDDKTLDPEGQLGNGDYRLGLLGVNTEPYVENGGYLRLREVGLYYTIPKSNLGDVVSMIVGFSGNNLVNFFDYNSYDPEVSNFGANGLSSGVEVTPFPSAKRWDVHVKFNF